MHTQVNGITIAYSDRGTGLPIVFLHAFPPKPDHVGSPRGNPLLALSNHHGRFARTWRIRRATLEQSADDVNALLDQLTIQQALFVGLSMGDYILFAFYRKYAVRARGLILADTRAQADTVEGIDGRFRMAQTAYKKGLAVMADIMLPKLLSPTTIQTGPDLVRQVRAILEGHQVSGIAGNLRAMAERPDSTPFLEIHHLPHPNHRW